MLLLKYAIILIFTKIVKILKVYWSDLTDKQTDATTIE